MDLSPWFRLEAGSILGLRSLLVISQKDLQRFRQSFHHLEASQLRIRHCRYRSWQVLSIRLQEAMVSRRHRSLWVRCRVVLWVRPWKTLRARRPRTTSRKTIRRGSDLQRWHSSLEVSSVSWRLWLWSASWPGASAMRGKYPEGS